MAKKYANLRGNPRKGRGHGFRRRNLIVKRKLQARFILGFSAVVFAGFIVNMVLAYILIDRRLGEELYKIHFKIRTTSEIAGPVLIALGAFTVPAVVLAAAVTGHYLTRRLETPLARFGDALREASGGYFGHHLRNASLGELSSAYNRTMRSMESTFRSLKKAESSMERRLAALSSALAGKKTPRTREAAKALSEISKARTKAAAEISRFKL